MAAMNAAAVVMVFGRDATGILASVSRVLSTTGCNITDCTLARLSDHFALMLKVTIPDGTTATTLSQSFDSLRQSQGLAVAVREADTRLAFPAKEQRRTYMLSLYGADQPGIVQTVSETLTHHSANITSLRTKVSGAKTFSTYIMIIDVELPTDADEAAFFYDLEKTADELGARLNVQKLDSG